MCGIAGVCHLDGRPVAGVMLRRMAESMAHRGPDGTGQYADGPVGLTNVRLAVIDLSPGGHQPMANEAGQVVLTYNGEIYNFERLRVELQGLGYRFHSASDSEVVVRSWEAWGDRCVGRFNGMFAFAVWDRREQRLFLARDRYGIKPLYYYHHGDVFVFGSEIKAILQHPDVTARVCYPALGQYFTFQNIFTDATLFEGIRLLPPGTTLDVRLGRGDVPPPRRYWDYRFQDSPELVSFDECAEELHRLFRQAVMRQMVSDVPVGSYLSGGIDSSSIAAVAVEQVRRLRTFTCGFDLSSASGLELGFDERRAAEVMCNRLKTEHYEIVLHAGDMEEVLPELTWHLEDLRVGQSYPNYYVARLASRFVKVVLSGSGGDELLAGYPWRYYRGVGAPDPDSYYRAYYDYWQRLIPDEERERFFLPSVYAQLKHCEPHEVFRDVFADADVPLERPEDFVNASLYFEAKTFLHGLFLVEDKLSMAHSLETRVPFMDNDLVDFATRIPARYKLRDLLRAPRVDENEPGKTVRYRHDPSSDGKVIMRHVARRFLPEEILARAKQGFSAPDASWFKGESIDYVNRLLRSRSARVNEFFERDQVARILDEHTSGRVNHRLLIWSLISFEWWCRQFLPGGSPA
jgi:asparagine synthase (glutamine-hydrolysing)